MKNAKLRSIIAFAGLMCMAVFVPIMIAIFAYPQLAKGALGWVALVTGLLGVGTCLAVRFLFRGDDKKRPSYLPDEEEKPKEAETEKVKGEQAAVGENEQAAGDEKSDLQESK